MEDTGKSVHCGSGVREIDTAPVAIEWSAYPKVSISRIFQDRVNSIVHHIQKDLLELVWIGGSGREILPQVQVDANVVHAQGEIAQPQRLLKTLPHFHLNPLTFFLPAAAQGILTSARPP